MTNPWRLTSRLAGMLVFAVAVFGAAANSLDIWLYGLTGILLATILVGIVGPVFATSGLRGSVTFVGRTGFRAPLPGDRGRVFVGDNVLLALKTNRDPRRLYVVALLSDGDPLDAELVCDDQNGAQIELPTSTRGRLRIQSVQLASRWPFGISTATVTIATDLNLVVNPRYVISKTASSAFAGTLGGESTARRGHGDDFVGLRRFSHGDSPRQVHWPTTARAAELMVVDRAGAAAQAVQFTLAIDNSATPEVRELAVMLAASLAASWTAARVPFRLRLDTGPELRQWPATLARLATLDTAVVTGDLGPTAVVARGNTVALTSGKRRTHIEPTELWESDLATLIGEQL